MLEREIKWKEENDFLISTVHSALSKDLRSDKEKEALVNLFVSKQTEKNKALINEQSNMIEHLKLRCSAYENEIKNLVESQRESALFSQVNQLHLEINLLRNLVYRLNVELSDYQAKNPSAALKSSIKKIDISSLPKRGPIPIWLINSKYLSPLIAAYDDKLKERETKISFFQEWKNLSFKSFELIEFEFKLLILDSRFFLN
ncbi:centrosomal of 89 kDa isoform X2 [Brachionus plicatilis]|uniref:Centrosomal of 89 kDa isoform X2 n=1 Tax=Brachionus plicatilis TaxID=10195 RepID=A0A3M7R163_BRAPC|nr:centrosomal of 89 kDa isoform X2 [Brachionus plicatilis]